ncbi:MAG: hypothetical protein JWP95_1682, partial [Actinotalea sp.]|nr:hypothetical protein [Actinotalea sp.]
MTHSTSGPGQGGGWPFDPTAGRPRDDVAAGTPSGQGGAPAPADLPDA